MRRRTRSARAAGSRPADPQTAEAGMHAHVDAVEPFAVGDVGRDRAPPDEVEIVGVVVAFERLVGAHGGGRADDDFAGVRLRQRRELSVGEARDVLEEHVDGEGFLAGECRRKDDALRARRAHSKYSGCV
ncbi:MAG: hypothetical protein U0521_02335 [Anaerolineae bacterium]